MADFSSAPVCLVTVTYADRSELLEQTLRAAFGEQIAHAVIVLNGASAAAAERIEQLWGDDSRVTLLDLGENTGSANGYGQGMQRAVDEGFPLIWLMDDDNVPRSGALVRLRTAMTGWRDGRVLASPIRVEQSNREHYDQPLLRYDIPGPGAFNYYDVRRSFAWRWYALARRPRPTLRDPVQLGMTAYGGLLLPAAAIREGGLPPVDFFLYGDDWFWTAQLVRAGWTILRVAGAYIDDVQDHWQSWESPYSTDLLTQVYYTQRNDAVFWRSRCRSGWDRLWYRINRRLALLLAWKRTGWGRRHPPNYRVIRAAIADAEQGRMGRIREGVLS